MRQLICMVGLLCYVLSNCPSSEGQPPTKDLAKLNRLDDELATKPGDVSLQIEKATYLGDCGDFVQELRIADELLARDATLRSAYLLKEHGLFGLKKYRAAIEALDNAFRLGRPSPQELLLKATLMVEDKQFKEALLISSQVIELNPDNARAYERRADCYYQLYGPCEMSLADLKKSAQLDPSCERVKMLIEIMIKHLTKPRVPIAGKSI